MNTKKPSLARRVLSNPSGFVPAFFLVLIVSAGFFAPVLSQFDPNFADITKILLPPGGEHWLGTDSAGRDVFARLLFGTNFSIGSAGLAVIIAIGIGVTSGLIAGYFGGWFDVASNWMTNLIMALPGIVVILAASSVLGPSIWLAMVVFGVLLSPSYYRLVYNTVRSVRKELFVDAARVSGLGDARILARHVLGAIRAPIIIQTGIIASIAIAIQAGLQFLGLGDSQVPSWGGLLLDGFSKLFRQPLLLVWPTLVIALTTLSFAALSNTIRDEIEGRSLQKRIRRQALLDASTVAMSRFPGPAIVHKGNPRSDSTLLSVRNLAIGYPNQAGEFTEVVLGVNLEVKRGEVVGLIGESGSGKTQTAFSVLGLLPMGGRALSGEIEFEGQSLLGLSSREWSRIRGKRVAYIPQEPLSNLDPSFTVGSQLVEPMKAQLKLTRKEAKERALSLLSRVGIADPERTYSSYPHEISGGMAQRVLIAGAVSCEPDLIIADEPTTALDVTVQAEVLELLRDLQRESGVAILLVTHNFGVVADLCDWLYVMRQGSIVESGSVRDVFGNPRHEYTKSLLDSILDGGPARESYVAPEGNKK